MWRHIHVCGGDREAKGESKVGLGLTTFRASGPWVYASPAGDFQISLPSSLSGHKALTQPAACLPLALDIYIHRHLSKRHVCKFLEVDS